MSNYFTSDDEKLKWTCGEKKSLLKTVVFDVTSSINTYDCGEGKVQGEYIVLDAPDWVIVIPETEDAATGRKDFFMVKQWRHGSKCLSVEFPGGVIDRGEEPETAARRELLEETGFGGGTWSLIGKYAPNPNTMNNWCYSFLAEGVTKIQEPQQEPTEDILLNYVSERELLALMQNGKIVEGIMLAPLWQFFHQRR